MREKENIRVFLQEKRLDIEAIIHTNVNIIIKLL